MSTINTLKADKLHELLGCPAPMRQADDTLARPFDQWDMARDDSPILRYLLRHAQPKRHLEFGTWQGFGAVCCLEETRATVWTINLPHGESYPDGRWAYPQELAEDDAPPVVCQSAPAEGGKRTYRTDALGFIGRFYINKNLGNRVCQIYCDSREWDDNCYPDGFFDTAFIDGGHVPDVVTSDTRKALRLVRPGGLIIWHDYCPDAHIIETVGATRNVVGAIAAMQNELRPALSSLDWIDRSYILLGVRR